jgi:hypothetical protein
MLYSLSLVSKLTYMLAVYIYQCVVCVYVYVCVCTRMYVIRSMYAEILSYECVTCMYV